MEIDIQGCTHVHRHRVSEYISLQTNKMVFQNGYLLREPVKSGKSVENSTLGGGSGPGHFPHIVYKMHFKPF